MKNYILSMVIVLSGICAQSQNPIVQIEQMDVEQVTQNGIVLTHTFSEPIVGVDMQNGITIISGFYPFVLFDSTVTSGIRDALPIEGLRVYPNPTRTKIILAGAEIHRGRFKIEVFDASGQYIRNDSWHPGAGIFELSLDPYAAGVFHVRVSDIAGGRLSHFKVIKQ